jgi:hypothetical protein
VWAEIERPEKWPEWWPGLEAVREVEAGDALGVGSVKEFVFKSFLPYTLSFHGRFIEVVPPRRFRVAAVGELEGTGILELSESGDQTTNSTFTWEVRTTKPWMNVVAPVAAPLFRWNHDQLMEKAGQGLGRQLGANVVVHEMSGPPLLVALAPIVGVGLLAWLVVRRARRS